MDFSKLMQEKGKCCATERPLADSKHINVVCLSYECTWEYPHHSNILIPGDPLKAVAVIHDDCYEQVMDKSLPIKYAIEIIDDKRIVYHPVETLKNLKHEREN